MMTPLEKLLAAISEVLASHNLKYKAEITKGYVLAVFTFGNTEYTLSAVLADQLDEEVRGEDILVVGVLTGHLQAAAEGADGALTLLDKYR